MNSSHKKCSSKKHEKVNATNYCQECRLYMCEKCNEHHKEFYIHQILGIKDFEESFTGICKEENHNNTLDYYCKTHNQLCCDSCIIKFKKNGKGLHSKCEIYPIEDVKDQMKDNLNQNIKLLEELSISLDKSINELKDIFEKINENKEAIKIKIQKIFTKLRNELNNREDELINKVDKKFEEIFFEEELIKKCEKLPKKVESSLSKAKLVNDKDKEDNNLNEFIYNCISLETYINDIKKLNENLIKSKSIKPNVNLFLNEEDINYFTNKVKSFGYIYYKNFDFENNDNKNYKISGENQNIFTCSSAQNWICIQTKNSFENDKKYIWKIKLLKSKNKNIFVGISPLLPNNTKFDFDLSLIPSNTSVEKYTTENPYRAVLRDNIIGEEFPVTPGKTYRILAKIKRISGDINLQGGIWYTSQTKGESHDGYSDEFKEFISYDNGFKLAQKDIKVPEGKIKGKFFFQIEQPHIGGTTSFFIADISIEELNNKNKSNVGYYLFLKNSKLFSGAPFNYKNKKTDLKIINDEIVIIMDMKEKTLKFIIDKDIEINHEDSKNIYYKDIQVDNPLFPTVLLYDENDSIAFLEQ